MIGRWQLLNLRIKWEPKVTKYVRYTGAEEDIKSIRRSGVKIDPMETSYLTVRVADWVPGAIKAWRDADQYGGMPLEEYLRKVGGRTPLPE